MASKGPWLKGKDANWLADAKGGKRGKLDADAKGGKKGKPDIKGKTAESSSSSAVSSLGAAAKPGAHPGKGKEPRSEASDAAEHAAEAAGKGSPCQKGKGPATGAAASASCGKGKDGKAAVAGPVLVKGRDGKEGASSSKGKSSAKGKGGAGFPLPFTAETVKECADVCKKAIRTLQGQFTEDGQQMVQIQIGFHTIHHVIQAANRHAATLPSNPKAAGHPPVREPSKSLPETVQEPAWTAAEPAWTAAEHVEEPAQEPAEEQAQETKASTPAAASSNQPSTQAAGQDTVAGRRLFFGTIQELDLEEEYGIVESAGVRELHNRDPFILVGQLTPQGEDRPIAQKGDHLIFALEHDEEDNLWTWEPIIPTSREFRGVVKYWDGGLKVGQVQCEELHEMIGKDVTLNALSFTSTLKAWQVTADTKIFFCLTLSSHGRLQATGAKMDFAHDEGPAKKARKVEPPGKGWKAAANSPLTSSSDAEDRRKTEMLSSWTSQGQALQEQLKRKQAEERERAKAKEASSSASSTWTAQQAAEPTEPASYTSTSSTWTQQQAAEPTEAASLSEADVESKLDLWVAARKRRDFFTADALRDELRRLGVDAQTRRPRPGW